MPSQLFRTSVSRIPLFCHHCRNILLVIALGGRHDLKPESKAIKHINNSAEARVARFAQRFIEALASEARFLGNSLHAARSGDNAERIWQNRWIPQL